MPGRTAPTIVLIGGRATLDSGATVDSRERLAGDDWDFVLRQALGTSEAWWTLAKNFVDVALAQHPDPNAWALAWVAPTIKRPRADDTFSRVRSKTLLDGAGSFLDVPIEAGKSTFRSDSVTTKYRLLPYTLRFADMKGGPPPAVIVGGFHTTYDDGTDIVGDRPLDYFVSRWPDAIIVLPHTPLVEVKARRVVENPPDGPVRVSGLADQTHPVESRSYVESAERLADLRGADSYVLSGDFRVTFWAEKGVVRDPVDLDAALTFVRSRFDLQLGLWDLARDPVLRTTLLQRNEMGEPNEAGAALPAELATKAKEKADERRQEKDAQRDGRRRHHEAIWPTLSKHGWQIPAWQPHGVDYRFPVGPSIPSLYSEGSTEPAMSLALGIQKRQAVVSLFEVARTERTEKFIRSHRALIESITGRPPEPDKQAVWRIDRKGWAESPDGWPKLLKTLEALVAELAPRLAELGKTAAAEHRKNRESLNVDLVVTVSREHQQPATKKKSMWSRLRGRDSS